MNMSQAVRRQLIGCDLVQGVIDATQESFARAGMEPPKEVHRILFELQRAADSASALACQRLDANGKWQLDEKATKQYSDALDGVKRKLKATYNETVPAIAFLKAAQLWAEDVRRQLPPHPANRRVSWRDMAVLMQRLHMVYDPEWCADELIDMGGEHGEQFKQAAGCW